MKKIPNVFERDWNGDTSRVLPSLNVSADVGWVLRGEGRATVKWDGTAGAVIDGRLHVRYDAKLGKDGKPKPIPPEFLPCQERDPKTGHLPGWVPAGLGPEHKWHHDGFARFVTSQIGRLGHTFADVLHNLEGRTFEIIGEKFQGNPYRLPFNTCRIHGDRTLSWFFPTPIPASDFYERAKEKILQTWTPNLETGDSMMMEGIVFHHLDGRMAKILSSDLGIDWKRG
jgi:hypothetical protein